MLPDWMNVQFICILILVYVSMLVCPHASAPKGEVWYSWFGCVCSILFLGDS